MEYLEFLREHKGGDAMSAKWESHRVRTAEEIFAEINTSRPVGIVIFGPDCEFKKQITSDVQRVTGALQLDYYHCYGGSGLAKWKNALFAAMQDDYPVCMVLSGEASASRQVRNLVVQQMQSVGIEKIFGIHVVGEAPFDSRRQEVVRDELSLNPPTIEGLTGLLTVANKEE